MIAPRPIRTVIIGAGVELLLVLAYVVLAHVIDGEALAAAMLGGDIGVGLIAGLLLVLLRLAVWVFVPMAVIGLSVRATVLTLVAELRPRSRTAPGEAPSPSRS